MTNVRLDEPRDRLDEREARQTRFVLADAGMVGIGIELRKQNMPPKSNRHMGPLELVVFYPGGKDHKVVRLPMEGKLSLGRGTHNDIVLEDTSVSRDHAVLHIASGLSIEDKSSRNGTDVYKPGRYSGTDTTIANHPERGRSFDVDVGDRITLGSVTVVIRKALFEPEKGSSGPRMWTQSPTIADPLMEALYEDVCVVAQSSNPVPILIYGETGAGKESIARAVHDASPRKSRSFVAVNCTQFAENLVASELFGHVKGAFTDAKTDKKGFLQAADTGTLFLDEIADLPLETQVKLLRVLDYGEVYPVGSTKPQFVDVRVVAATNKNLLDCLRQKTFREDLYYRLRGFEFEVPPLRKRPKDIIALAERFLSDACRQDNQPNTLRFSEATLACLRSYAFPGNVRELKKAVEVASVRCRGAMILPEHLPPEISKQSIVPPEPESTPNVRSLPNDMKARIIHALEVCGGNQKKAAALMGISNRTLVNWLDRFPEIPRPKKSSDKSRPIVDLPPTTSNTCASSQPHDGWPQGEF